MKTPKFLIALLTSTAWLMTGCSGSSPSFSILGTQQSFQQGADTFAQKQVDILWVVDNSGSMQTSQANLATNFAAFIQNFQTLGLDYHMAVTTTDAYLAGSYFNNAYSAYSPTAAQFRQGSTGTYGQGLSGVTVMNPGNTTASIFQKNMSEGTDGSGDERAFSSFVQALSDPTNATSGFRRPGAFLSIIILSDEDDFSGNASFCDHFQSSCAANFVGDHNYNVPAPELQPASFYVSWLDTYAGGHTHYSVNAIYTDTAACARSLSSTSVVGQRYPQIVSLTGGVSASLCSNFAATLNTISQSVIQLASVFVLASQANPATIVVTVNGVTVPQNATNGWQYTASTNSVAFYGTAVPPAGASINIAYTPLNAHQ